MAPAGVELLVVGVNRVVDRLRVEGRVDVTQQRNDIGVAVSDAADLEVILVHVDHVQVVLPESDLAERAQLGARSLEELQRSLDAAGSKVMRGQRSWHDDRVHWLAA